MMNFLKKQDVEGN